MFLLSGFTQPARRSSLINRGYYIRCHAVRTALAAFVTTHGPNCQIVSLGAGFDTAFWVLDAAGVRPAHFFEVDFAHVVRNKSTLITHTPALWDVLVEPRVHTGGEGVRSQRYSLVAGDLCAIGDVRVALAAAGFDVKVPTLVLAECVLTYMSTVDSASVLHWARTALQCATVMVYEQIRPEDAFGRVMRANLDRCGSSLLGIHSHPSVAAQRKRFAETLHYPHVRVQTILGIWQRLDPAQRRHIENLEEFDEYEEWIEKCAHYVIITASHHALPDAGPDDPDAGPVAQPPLAAPWTTREQIKCGGRSSDAQLWGHSVVAWGARLVVFGGYGGAHRHERVNALFAVDCAQPAHAVQPLTARGLAPVARVSHCAVLLSSPSPVMVVHGGRTNPSSPLADVHTLSLASMEWRRLDVAAPARYRHTLTAVLGTSVVVGFGGKRGWRTGDFCGDLWVVDTVKLLCTRVEFASPEQPSARASHCALWIDGALVIYGGIDEHGSVLSDVWRVTFEDASFSRARATLLSHLTLPPRFAHSAVVHDDMALFVGGVHEAHCNTVVVVPCAAFAGGGALAAAVFPVPELMSRHQCAVVGNRVYALGGGLTCFSFGSTFADHLTAFTFGPHFDCPVADTASIASAATATATMGRVSRSIPRLENPTREQFRDWVTRVREPCLFAGRGVDVPRWTKADVLAAVPPDASASIHVCTGPLLDFANKNYEFQVVPFAQMMNRIEDPAEHLYFRSLGANARKDPSSVADSFPALAAQFLIPEFARDVTGTAQGAPIHSSCLRISSADVQMWTHYDINDNLLCGVRGRKRLVLFHPEEVRHLYADGTASLVLDVDQPDLLRFPKFAKAMAWTGVLEEGDVLFIPAMWWHNTRTLTPCYGINVFFEHLPSAAYQPNDLYGNRDPVLAQRAQKSIQAALAQLAELPEEYRRFFTRKLILEMKQAL